MLDNLTLAKSFGKKKVKRVRVKLSTSQSFLKSEIEKLGYKVLTNKISGGIPVNLFIKSHKIGIVVTPDPKSLNFRGVVTPLHIVLVYSDQEVQTRSFGIVEEIKKHIRSVELSM